MLQRLRAADGDRIGQDEAAALVQLPEGRALVSSCHVHVSLPCWPRRDGDVPPRALVRVVHRAAVLWRLLAIIHAVVADDAGDTQVIIGEDFCAALGLGAAVLHRVAPGLHGRLVPPERHRQDLALVGQALETLDRDEAVDGLQDRLEVGREVEIILAVFRLGPDLEDHGDHGLLLELMAYNTTYKTTWRRNV